MPFNYIIPGESINGILPFRQLVDRGGPFTRFHDQLQHDVETKEVKKDGSNEFSGPTYRVINFVADLPVRIDDALAAAAAEQGRDLGNTIFVLTEFQIMDAVTADTNESGENSHAAYKERQVERVKGRLAGGSRPRNGNGS